MLKKLFSLLLCFLMLTPYLNVEAAGSNTTTTYQVSSMEEADAAILDSLNKQATKMVLELDNLDYYDTYNLIIPYTRGLGTYNTHNFGYAVNSGTWTSLEINVTYYTSQTEENYLDKAVKDLATDLKKDSDFETVKAVHDYICENTVYSDKTAENVAGYSYHSAYDALVKHEAVCSGYALLFQRFMDELNIPSYVFIDGNEVAHAWNIVNVDGNWYQVDCTWDDKNGGYTYDNFLKADGLKGHAYTGDIKLADTNYESDELLLTSNN